MSEKVDQKEYLKKYLSGPKKKKVKKVTSRVKVLDYNDDDKNLHLESEEFLELTGEDAPQIVNVFDEDSNNCLIASSRTQLKWKNIANNPETQIQDLGPTKRKKLIKCGESDSESEIKKQKIDLSPPRKTIRSESTRYKNVKVQDLSPPRKSKNGNYKRDISPIRRISTQEKTELEKNSQNISFMEPVVHKTTKKYKENPEKLLNQKMNEAAKTLYQQWGKGVRQVELYKEKNESDLYESTKPLARYSDDADLEKFLKEQERHGDPMQAYINNKCTKKNTETATYKGYVSENRFNIRPGYRWDGVNRSNGYEEKYFEQQSNKKINLSSNFDSEDF